MCIEVFLKEELALAIDKQFQFTISYYTIVYPTKDMQKLTFSYPNNFSYPNVFENQSRGTKVFESLLYLYNYS